MRSFHKGQVKKGILCVHLSSLIQQFRESASKTPQCLCRNSCPVTFKADVCRMYCYVHIHTYKQLIFLLLFFCTPLSCSWLITDFYLLNQRSWPFCDRFRLGTSDRVLALRDSVWVETAFGADTDNEIKMFSYKPERGNNAQTSP